MLCCKRFASHVMDEYEHLKHLHRKCKKVIALKVQHENVFCMRPENILNLRHIFKINSIANASRNTRIRPGGGAFYHPAEDSLHPNRRRHYITTGFGRVFKQESMTEPPK